MEILEFKKLKAGMLVTLAGPAGRPIVGRLLSKQATSKRVLVRQLEGPAGTMINAPYNHIIGMPDPDPFDQIHPILATTCKDEDLEALLDSAEWAAEPKFDGERQILAHNLGRRILFRATTRVVGKNSGELGDNTGKIGHFRALPVPGYGPTVIDVELLHDHGDTIEERFRSLRSIMGSDDDKAIAKQAEIGPVVARAFDLLWFGGDDLRSLPQKERRRILTEWYSANIAGTELERVFKLSDYQTTPEGKRELLDWLLENGWEGMMLKHINAPYTDTRFPDQRSPYLRKVKPFMEDDVIITGFGYGTGMYNQHKISRVHIAQLVRPEDATDAMLDNTLNPADFGLTDGEHLVVDMGTTSALTDAQEQFFRANPDSFVGIPIEVRFQTRWSATGKMRHPSFLRVREDKTPRDCVYLRAA